MKQRKTTVFMLVAVLGLVPSARAENEKPRQVIIKNVNDGDGSSDAPAGQAGSEP